MIEVMLTTLLLYVNDVQGLSPESVKAAMSEGDCSNAYHWIFFPFKKDQSGYQKRLPNNDMFFHQGTGEAESSTTYELLSPISYASANQAYAVECQHQCTIYIQKVADDGNTPSPSTVSAGFVCDTAFEEISSSNNNNKDKFTYASDTTTLTVDTTNAFTTYVCYKCTATPTGANSGDATKVQTIKTDAIKIQVGDCTANLPSKENSYDLTFIQDTSSATSSVGTGNNHYITIAPFSGSVGCINQYVLDDRSNNRVPHVAFTGFNTWKQNSNNKCHDLAVGLACTVFNFDASSVISGNSGEFYVGATLYDGTEIDVFSNRVSITVQAPTDSSCSQATITCAKKCDNSAGSQSADFVFTLGSGSTFSPASFIANYNEDCSSSGGVNGIGSFYFQSSDSTNCPLKGTKIFSDSAGARQIQNDDYSRDTLLMKTDHKYESSWQTDSDKVPFAIDTDTLKVNTQTKGFHAYILRGYNKYGKSGDCTIRMFVCGYEDIAPKTAYTSAAVQINAVSSPTQAFDKNSIFNSDFWDISVEKIDCIFQFPDSSTRSTKFNLQGWDTVNSATTTLNSKVTVAFDTDGYPTITIDTNTARTFNTKLSVTTQGGKTASIRFDFIVPQPTTEVSLVTSPQMPIQAFNTLGDMTQVQNFLSSTYLPKFQTNNADNPVTSLLIQQLDTATGRSKEASITQDSDEDKLINIGTDGNLKIDFSFLPTVQISKFYMLTAQTSIPASDAYTQHIFICMPPYMQTAMAKLQISVIYDGDDFLTATLSKNTQIIGDLSGTKSQLDGTTFTYDLPTMRFNAADLSKLQDYVDLTISQVDNTELQSKLSLDSTANHGSQSTFKLKIVDLGSLIDSLSTNVNQVVTRQMDTTYNVDIKTSPKSSATLLGNPLSLLQDCVYYQRLQVQIQCQNLDRFYLTSSTDSVITTFNSETELAATKTFAKTTYLAKFSSTDQSKPLTSLVIGQINSTGNLIDASITDQTETSFIYISASGDLVIDFSKIPVFQISKRYALSVATVLGRNGIANPQTGHANGYIMEICIPPYFQTAFDDLTITLSYAGTFVNYDMNSAKTSLKSGKSKTYAQLNADTLKYSLPTVLFGSYDTTWVKTNVDVSISTISSSLQPYITVSDFALNVASTNDLIDALSSKTKVLVSTDYEIILKTQLKNQTVDTIDYSATTWQQCVYYQKLKLTIVSSYSKTAQSTWFNATQEFEKISEVEPETVEKDVTQEEEEVVEDVVEEKEIQNEQAEAEADAEKDEIEEQEFNVEEDFDVEPKPPTVKTKPLQFKSKVDSQGGLVIKFNQKLVPSNIFKYLKNTKGKRKLEINEEMTKILSIDFNKDPTAEVDEEDDDPSKIFTVQFNEAAENGKSIKFQIVFDKPPEISSQGDLRDQLSLQINKEQFKKLFITENGEYLKFNNEQANKIQYDISLPLQSPPASSEQFKTFVTQKSVATGQMNGGLLTVAINYLLKAAFGQIWSAAYALQLITYLTLINIMYPQCVKDLFDVMIELAAFDLVPEEYYQPIQEIILPIKSDYGYSHALIEIGYETGQILVTMFMIGLILVLQFIYYVFFFMIYKCTKRISKLKKLHNYSKSCLVDRYSFFQRTLLGCSLEIFISGFIEISMRQTLDPYETASFYTSVALIAILVWFCFKTFIIFKNEQMKMKNTEIFPVFNNKWYVIWEEMAGESGHIAPYQLFFILRRLLYAAVIILIPSYTTCNAFFQYAIVIQLNLYSVAFVCDRKPFDSHNRNNTEIFNEWINLTISMLLMITMKFDGQDFTKSLYDIGLICNYLLLAMIGTNLLFVAYGIAKDVRLNFLRSKNLKIEKEIYKQLWLEAKQNGKDDNKKAQQLQIKMKEVEKLQAGEEEPEEIQDCLIEESLDEEDKKLRRPMQKRGKHKKRAKKNQELQVIREASDEDIDSTLENQDRNAAMEKTTKILEGSTSNIVFKDTKAEQDEAILDPFQSPSIVVKLVQPRQKQVIHWSLQDHVKQVKPEDYKNYDPFGVAKRAQEQKLRKMKAQDPFGVGNYKTKEDERAEQMRKNDPFGVGKY